MNNSRQSRYGFTLVELLVVVGIISVLIALLMPALTKLRKDAMRVKCASNLRSIGQALRAYTEHYGYYPGGAFQGFVALWPVRLRAFTGGDRDVFYCPEADESCRWRRYMPLPPASAALSRYGYEEGEPVLDWRFTLFSYGYNIWGASGTGGPITVQKGLGFNIVAPDWPDRESRDECRELRASRVRVPSEMIAIADSTRDGDWDFAIVSFADLPTGAGKQMYPAPVHSGGTNVLFCDGHVQWYPHKDLLIGAKPPDDLDEKRRYRMWNNDQSHPYDHPIGPGRPR